MKFTSDKRERVYSILAEKMSEFWSEVASEFPEAKASMISSFRKPYGERDIVGQVQSWYEDTSETDSTQCASILEGLIEDGIGNIRNQQWSDPDDQGKGTLELLVRKTQLTKAQFGGLSRCLRDNLNELNRELAQIRVWDIDNYLIYQIDEYFNFTSFQIESFKQANRGLLITFSYSGYDNY